MMKRLLKLVLAVVVMSSCHNQLDYGIDWGPGANEVQITQDSLEIELGCSI